MVAEICLIGVIDVVCNVMLELIIWIRSSNIYKLMVLIHQHPDDIWSWWPIHIRITHLSRDQYHCYKKYWWHNKHVGMEHSYPSQRIVLLRSFSSLISHQQLKFQTMQQPHPRQPICFRLSFVAVASVMALAAVFTCIVIHRRRQSSRATVATMHHETQMVWWCEGWMDGCTTFDSLVWFFVCFFVFIADFCDTTPHNHHQHFFGSISCFLATGMSRQVCQHVSFRMHIHDSLHRPCHMVSADRKTHLLPANNFYWPAA